MRQQHAEAEERIYIREFHQPLLRRCEIGIGGAHQPMQRTLMDLRCPLPGMPEQRIERDHRGVDLQRTERPHRRHVALTCGQPVPVPGDAVIRQQWQHDESIERDRLECGEQIDVVRVQLAQSILRARIALIGCRGQQRQRAGHIARHGHARRVNRAQTCLRAGLTTGRSPLQGGRGRPGEIQTHGQRDFARVGKRGTGHGPYQRQNPSRCTHGRLHCIVPGAWSRARAQDTSTRSLTCVHCRTPQAHHPGHASRRRDIERALKPS